MHRIVDQRLLSKWWASIVRVSKAMVLKFIATAVQLGGMEDSAALGTELIHKALEQVGGLNQCLACYSMVYAQLTWFGTVCAGRLQSLSQLEADLRTAVGFRWDDSAASAIEQHRGTTSAAAVVVGVVICDTLNVACSTTHMLLQSYKYCAVEAGGHSELSIETFLAQAQRVVRLREWMKSLSAFVVSVASATELQQVSAAHPSVVHRSHIYVCCVCTTQGEDLRLSTKALMVAIQSTERRVQSLEHMVDLGGVHRWMIRMGLGSSASTRRLAWVLTRGVGYQQSATGCLKIRELLCGANAPLPAACADALMQ